MSVFSLIYFVLIVRIVNLSVKVLFPILKVSLKLTVKKIAFLSCIT
jgi:hypothetical protein